MARYFNDVSRTFNEYLLIPGLTTKVCFPENVSLKTPLVRYQKGTTPELELNIRPSCSRYPIIKWLLP